MLWSCVLTNLGPWVKEIRSEDAMERGTYTTHSYRFRQASCNAHALVVRVENEEIG